MQDSWSAQLQNQQREKGMSGDGTMLSSMVSERTQPARIRVGEYFQVLLMQTSSSALSCPPLEFGSLALIPSIIFLPRTSTPPGSGTPLLQIISRMPSQREQTPLLKTTKKLNEQRKQLA